MYGYNSQWQYYADNLEKGLRLAWDGQQVIYQTTKSNLQIAFREACQIQERLRKELGETSKQGSLTIQAGYDTSYSNYDYNYEELWKRWKDKDRQYTWTPNSKEKIWTPDNETEQQGRLS